MGKKTLTEVEIFMAENRMEEEDFQKLSRQLFEWILSEKRTGRIIASIEEREDKYVFRELVLPGLTVETRTVN